MIKLLGVALVLVVLSGCQTLPTGAAHDSPAHEGSGATAAAEAAQQARAQALGLDTGDCLQPGWAISGRMAIANGKDAGSGRFEWTQGAGQFRLQLSAPVTAQTWVLATDAQGASLEGLQGGTQRGTRAADLLRDATGFELPVQALGCWIRAVAASSANLGAAQIRFDAQQLPQQIEQGGWQIDYSRWQMDPFTRLLMPARIDARHGTSRVRLSVDRWGLE